MHWKYIVERPFALQSKKMMNEKKTVEKVQAT